MVAKVNLRITSLVLIDLFSLYVWWHDWDSAVPSEFGNFLGGKHHSERSFYFLRTTVIISLIVVLTTELDLQYLRDEIVSTLKLSRHVELNPGPYEIIRSVQRGFNQGNVT